MREKIILLIAKIIFFIAIWFFCYPIFFGLCTVLFAGMATGWRSFEFWPPFFYGAQTGIKVGLISTFLFIPTLWLISRSKRRNAKR